MKNAISVKFGSICGSEQILGDFSTIYDEEGTYIIKKQYITQNERAVTLHLTVNPLISIYNTL